MAQTQLYTKKAQIFVKEEATQDTYVTMAAGDMILAEIGDSAYTVEGENYQPSTVRGDFLSSDEIPGNATATLTFRVAMHGSGTIDSAPEFGEALKACGFEETTNASTSVVYTPLSTFNGTNGNPGPSYSAALYEDGNAYLLKGGFGNVTFMGEVGLPCFAEFVFTGAFQAADEIALETQGYDTPVGPAFQGGAFSMNFGGAVTPKGINQFTLDMGNTVTPVGDMNEASGIYGARITNRKSVGTFDPEMVLQETANSDFYALSRAGTTGTLTTGTIGGTTGNKYSIAVARCVMRPIEQQNREGVRVITVPYAVSSAGTDVEGTNPDITLTFT